MKIVKRLVVAACAAVAFSGHAASAAQAPSPPPQSSQATPPPLLQIGPGDKLSIDVFGSAELTTVTNVSDDGTIRMPLAGAIQVAGQSPAEAGRRIEAALKAGQFMINPQVTVLITESLARRVSVTGEVANPGRYPIESNSTVLDVIAMAGGLGPKGSELVTILRTDKSGAVQRLSVDLHRLMFSPDATTTALQTLQGGDTVIVPTGTFFINGQVVTPGEYRVEGEMKLFQAIARAGGITPLGSSSRVRIKRCDPNGKCADVKARNETRIQVNDVITVKERLW
jgi:polysaccharide export outer membrane protein